MTPRRRIVTDSSAAAAASPPSSLFASRPNSFASSRSLRRDRCSSTSFGNAAMGPPCSRTSASKSSWRVLRRPRAAVGLAPRGGSAPRPAGGASNSTRATSSELARLNSGGAIPGWRHAKCVATTATASVSISRTRFVARRSCRESVAGANATPARSIDANTGTSGISIARNASSSPLGARGSASFARTSASSESADATANAAFAPPALTPSAVALGPRHLDAARIASASTSPANRSNIPAHGPRARSGSTASSSSGCNTHAAIFTSTTGAAIVAPAPIARSCGFKSTVTFPTPERERTSRTRVHGSPRVAPPPPAPCTIGA
eukprot:27760-Pelagococcus_subviridis.AAC.6